uniref:NADH-ubiquinone oxidoreductase chain 4 n=1 Tax=Hydrophilidae sp. BMNH 1274336 TaxID=1796516 RepID=A0A126TFH5_9COLE|nr:NADH dehydrogenase subunit 4 [Hydrophilidae sp. BMNH 1274336]
MMKMMMMMVMVIPLCFKVNLFWFVQWMYFFMTILFFLMFGFDMNFVNISYFFGYDLLSFVMMLLSMWICSLMIMGSSKIYKTNNYYSFFLFMVLLLMISLFLTFASLNLFIFYLFFEISLIPTLLLIIGWGYQPERLQAGVYLLFYTMFASLPMLLGIFYIYMNVNTLDYFFLQVNFNSILLYISINMVFFVKMPMFFIHLWLPKAHVEAPVSGSMILAGVMLKLGGYGLLRVMIMFIEIGMKLNLVIVIISLVGGFYVSLICLRQVDMKSLIAYSSVSHMGLTVSGIMTLNYWGMIGSLVMMLAHGLCSSGLFCLANISYERISSRSLYLNKGMINFLPVFSLWWFLFSACNMAAPPSLNLLGEIMLINSLVSWSVYTMVFLALMSFFSAAYSLFLYSFTQHGKLYSGSFSFYMGYMNEYLLLFLHWIPLNFLILKSEYFSIWL